MLSKLTVLSFLTFSSTLALECHDQPEDFCAQNLGESYKCLQVASGVSECSDGGGEKFLMYEAEE